MTTLLLRHAEVLVTMDAERREINDGGLFARDGWIEQVGPTKDLPTAADRTIDMRGCVVLPGLINTHHHLYQTLTRAVPGAQNAGLFDWLVTLYPIWARLRPGDIRISTQLGLAELALTGCTTASDHLYLFPNGSRLDDQIEAAADVGLRLHASRGSMSLGESEGGLPPDSVVETESEILADTQRLIETYHDPAPGSMLQIVVAPCSPFSVSPDLMRESAALAREYGVHLHTHLAETVSEEQFCLERFGSRPVIFAQELNWSGEDVWYAHAVHVSDREVWMLAEAGVGVAHCPSSNMRLASGIAPVQAYRHAGVPVGLGVDGSASNDSSHMLAEARMAMMLARLATAVQGGGDHRGLLSARSALEMATIGGAAVLGRDDIGSLEPGMCADAVAVNLDRLEYSGAHHDPVAAAIFCTPLNVTWNIVHGEVVVGNGQLVGLDLPSVIDAHQAAARRLISGE